MSGNMEARCIADVKAVLGEGPIWVGREQALYWVDIKGFKIFRLGEGDELSVWPTPYRIGSLAPWAEGGFIAGTDQGFARVDPEKNLFELLFDPEPERANNRFNDGKADRSGRFWAGTMDDTESEASGALYRVGANLAPIRVDDGYRVTNGPAFSPDGRTMYHSDSARQVIYAFDLDHDGNASNRREFARFGEGEGYPDGMTVDSQGCLWSAFWDGWCVRRFSPAAMHAEDRGAGPEAHQLRLWRPALDRLYVTSASIGLDEKALAVQPCAGGLFLLEPGLAGVAEVPFAG
jgi:sugar lactone lactonase YvrE